MQWEQDDDIPSLIPLSDAEMRVLSAPMGAPMSAIVPVSEFWRSETGAPSVELPGGRAVPGSVEASATGPCLQGMPIEAPPP